MSKKTKFQTTPSLLSGRKALHLIVDLLWQNGPFSRTQVYLKLSDMLGYREMVHISDLSLEELRLAIRKFQEELASLDILRCSACQYLLKCEETGLLCCTKYGSFYEKFKAVDEIVPCEEGRKNEFSKSVYP